MSDIKIEVRQNKVATVTLSRAPANAFVSSMYVELANAFIELGQRDDVAVIILRADGKIFCAGNDISDFSAFETRSRAEEAAEVCGKAASAIWKCKKPVIAAVQGAAMGAGLAVVAVCDFIIAGAGVKMGIPEVSLGIPAAGVFAHLMVPMHRAKYMAYTGQPLTAEEFERWGSVMKVVPKAEVWQEADAFAEQIAASCYRAVGVFRQTFNKNLDARLYDKFLTEQASFWEHMLDSHDFKEAVDSYNEKRPPVFTGK